MRLNERAVKMASSALGLGFLPVASGTWASAAAAVVYVVLHRLLVPSGADGPTVPCVVVLAGLFLIAVALGFMVCPAAQRLYGQRDPRPFVLDELAGQWLTCLLFWWRGPTQTVIAAFVAFRFFDILKPFPIRRIEGLRGAWGVMADDLLAALYAAGTLWALRYAAYWVGLLPD